MDDANESSTDTDVGDEGDICNVGTHGDADDDATCEDVDNVDADAGDHGTDDGDDDGSSATDDGDADDIDDVVGWWC